MDVRSPPSPPAQGHLLQRSDGASNPRALYANPKTPRPDFVLPLPARMYSERVDRGCENPCQRGATDADSDTRCY